MSRQTCIGAEQLGIKSKPVTQLTLPEGERAVLLMTPVIDKNLHKKIASANRKLTVGEVGASFDRGRRGSSMPLLPRIRAAHDRQKPD